MARLYLAFAVASASVGCGYTSDYLTPGHAPPRAVWQDDRLVLVAAASSLPLEPASGDAASSAEPRGDASGASVRLQGDLAHGGADAARAVARSVPKLPRMGGGGGGKDAALVIVIGVLIAAGAGRTGR